MLAVRSISVGEKSLQALVFVSDRSYMRTANVHDLPKRAIELLPGLRRHSCDNAAEVDFVREMSDTESVHLLEHVACELMALSGSPRALRGQTEWDFARDGRGVFRVTLQFDDDLVAMAALDEAVRIVEWLLGGSGRGDAPEIETVIRRLTSLRDDGAG